MLFGWKNISSGAMFETGVFGGFFGVNCLCWGFTTQSTQWGYVEHGQFT